MDNYHGHIKPNDQLVNCLLISLRHGVDFCCSITIHQCFFIYTLVILVVVQASCLGYIGLMHTTPYWNLCQKVCFVFFFRLSNTASLVIFMYINLLIGTNSYTPVSVCTQGTLNMSIMNQDLVLMLLIVRHWLDLTSFCNIILYALVIVQTMNIFWCQIYDIHHWKINKYRIF